MEVVQSPLLNSVKVEEKQESDDIVMVITITYINIWQPITWIYLMK